MTIENTLTPYTVWTYGERREFSTLREALRYESQQQRWCPTAHTTRDGESLSVEQTDAILADEAVWIEEYSHGELVHRNAHSGEVLPAYGERGYVARRMVEVAR